jgi:hypothetical protein
MTLIVQSLIQSVILLAIFLGFIGKFKAGVFFDNFAFEMFVTLFMTLTAATALGLVISSLVHSGDKAMTIAPFVLIIQLLFSGILFDLKGITKYISYVTISRWSVGALGSITKINKMKTSQAVDPDIDPALRALMKNPKDALFTISKAAVLHDWEVLLLMSILCLCLGGIILRRLKYDRR